MRTVKQLMKEKIGCVWTIAPQDSVYKALEVMAEKNMGALVVVEDKKVVGIFSERDYARSVVRNEKSPKDTSVSELMDGNVCYIRPEQTIDECVALFTNKRIRHLPVLEMEKLVGLVTIGDAVKQYLADKDLTIQQLENYITGSI